MEKHKVSAWNDGKNVFGINLINGLREKLFDRKWIFIELSIENKESFKIKLSDSFWKNCNELRHKNIKDWFFENDIFPWTKGCPPKFYLINIEGNRFLLEKIIE